MLNNSQTILLQSKGFDLSTSSIDGAVEYNLVNVSNGLVVHRTRRKSVMMQYLKAMYLNN